jgi:pyruvate formate lyase activating enzyme
MGFEVKLDTNGYNPKVLQQLIDDRLLDYVAMDIKNSKEGYGKTVGIENFDIAPIEQSVEILKKGDVDFEFRTTVVANLHSPEDIENIGRWIKPAKKYFLQGFKDSGDLIESGMQGYSEQEMKNLLKLLQNTVPTAEIR